MNKLISFVRVCISFFNIRIIHDTLRICLVINEFCLIMLSNIVICRGQAEKEFRVEVEAIGHVRHKNLVRLLGYCVEGTQRWTITFLIAPLFCFFSAFLLLNYSIEATGGVSRYCQGTYTRKRIGTILVNFSLVHSGELLAYSFLGKSGIRLEIIRADIFLMLILVYTKAESFFTFN